jgi:HK97 family phage prohead protease
MATDPKKPYGDVEYADPGYQEDGKKRYPLDSEDHCRAAWSYINMPKNADKYAPEQLAKIKGRIKAAGEKYGIEFADDEASRADDTSEQGANGVAHEIMRYARSWPLDDIAIRSGGDGRTVEAYAAVFDTPSEIRDQHGHYLEVISRSAFNRAISHGIERIGVFYHHGMDLHGNPAQGPGSVPIGAPLDVRADAKGLRTVTRFNQDPFADSVLAAIRNNAIRGYSFRGKIFQSTPSRVPRSRGNDLPTITRTELGLSEYGPTPTPAYADAGILAVRSVTAVAAQLASLDRDERAELIRILAASTPLDPDPTPADPETDDTATPDVGPGTEDPPDDEVERSGRKQRLAEIMASLHAKGIM